MDDTCDAHASSSGLRDVRIPVVMGYVDDDVEWFCRSPQGPAYFLVSMRLPIFSVSLKKLKPIPKYLLSFCTLRFHP